MQPVRPLGRGDARRPRTPDRLSAAAGRRWCRPSRRAWKRRRRRFGAGVPDAYREAAGASRPRPGTGATSTWSLPTPGEGITGGGGTGPGPRACPNGRAIARLRSQVAATLAQHNLEAPAEGDQPPLSRCSSAPTCPPRCSTARCGLPRASSTAWAWQSRGRVFDLALFRYESDAAGEDWDGGGWTVDLRWEVAGSFPLFDARDATR